MTVPHIRSATSPLPGRAKALAALATVSLALVAAGPASAAPKPSTPPAKKGCEVELKGPGAGQSIVYPDGYSFSVHGQNDNKTHTYTCNDGTWKETVSLTAPPTTGGLAAQIAAGGTFQVLASGAGELTGGVRAPSVGSATYLAATP